MKVEAPATARSTAAALQPQPFAGDRLAVLASHHHGACWCPRCQRRVAHRRHRSRRQRARLCREIAGPCRQRAGGGGQRRGSGGARRHGRRWRRRPPRRPGAACGRRHPRGHVACPVGARPAPWRDALQARDRRHARAGDLRSAVGTAQPGDARGDRRRTLRRRRQPARCPLAMAPGRLAVGRIARAGPTAAGPALLYRAGAAALLGDRQERGRQPRYVARGPHQAQYFGADAGRHRHPAARDQAAGRAMGQEGRRARALRRPSAGEGRRRSVARGLAAWRAHAGGRPVVGDAAAARRLRRG